MAYLRPAHRCLPSRLLNSLPGARLVGLLLFLASLVLPADTAAAQEPAGRFDLPIRYRTQLDGTQYQSGNYGPASLGMIVLAFRDEYIETTDLREQANIMQGSFGAYDSGTSCEVLTAIGRRYGAIPLNLYDAGSGYHQWTLDEVRADLKAGYPVMPQTKL